jgi:hypothetical protein
MKTLGTFLAFLMMFAVVLGIPALFLGAWYLYGARIDHAIISFFSNIILR